MGVVGMVGLGTPQLQDEQNEGKRAGGDSASGTRARCRRM